MQKITSLICLVILLFAPSRSLTETEQNNRLFFVLVSEGEPVQEVSFSNVTIHSRGKKLGDSASAFTGQLKVSLQGRFTDPQRKLFISGKEVKPAEDGTFKEILGVEMEENTLAIPIFARGKRIAFQEAVLRISLPQQMVDRISQGLVEQDENYVLGKEGAIQEEVIVQAPVVEPETVQAPVVQEPPPVVEQPREVAAGQIEEPRPLMKEDRLLFFARVTATSPIDTIWVAPLFGVAAQLPLAKSAYAEFDLLGAGGTTPDLQSAIIVEPGLSLGLRLGELWSFSTGVVYQKWFGATSDSFLVPNAGLGITFREAKIVRLKNIRLLYARVLSSDVHTDQARLSFSFQL